MVLVSTAAMLCCYVTDSTTSTAVAPPSVLYVAVHVTTSSSVRGPSAVAMRGGLFVFVCFCQSPALRTLLKRTLNFFLHIFARTFFVQPYCSIGDADFFSFFFFVRGGAFVMCAQFFRCWAILGDKDSYRLCLPPLLSCCV